MDAGRRALARSAPLLRTLVERQRCRRQPMRGVRATNACQPGARYRPDARASPVDQGNDLPPIGRRSGSSAKQSQQPIRPAESRHHVSERRPLPPAGSSQPAGNGRGRSPILNDSAAAPARCTRERRQISDSKFRLTGAKVVVTGLELTRGKTPERAGVQHRKPQRPTLWDRISDLGKCALGLLMFRGPQAEKGNVRQCSAPGLLTARRLRCVSRAPCASQALSPLTLPSFQLPTELATTDLSTKHSESSQRYEIRRLDVGMRWMCLLDAPHTRQSSHEDIQTRTDQQSE